MIFFAFVIFVVFLTYIFDDLLESQFNPNQHVNTVQSGTQKEITLERNKFGHYVSSGFINNTPVVFLLDTGATNVAISSGLAHRLGLKKGRAFKVSTANGISTAYRTTLDSVSLGSLQLDNVSASILSNASDDHVLLGMAFLKHMEIIQKGEQLTIRQ